jgi:hypothetical protein
MAATNYFWDRAQMDAAQLYPNILAIGDSWFWYPFLGGSLVNNIGRIVAPKAGVIYAQGNNGAEAFDYVDGKYAHGVREALRLYGSALQGVLISGGGNDFAGFNDLRPLLKTDCGNETSAPDCFRGGNSGLDAFFARMDGYYRRLIGEIYTNTPLGCKILMHTYDYAIPDGRAVFGGSAWLRPALDNAGVPAGLQQDCIRCLIDKFHDMLDRVCANDRTHLFVVDSRGTLNDKSLWANELHPTSTGFAKIADERWAPVLEATGLA